MAKERTPDRSVWLTQLPSTVEVTVLPGHRAHPLRERTRKLRERNRKTGVAAKAGITASLLLLAALVGAVLAETMLSNPARLPPAASMMARGVGPAGVAAAYGYPLRCLSVTVTGRDRSYARADFNRGSQCGQFDGDVTAIFRYVNGAWRSVFDGLAYSCPVPWLPESVQTALAVCPGVYRIAQPH